MDTTSTPSAGATLDNAAQAAAQTIGNGTATATPSTPAKPRKTPGKTPAKPRKTPAKRTDADPLDYNEPKRQRPAGFTVWTDAFDEINRIARIGRTQVKDRDARGEFVSRDGKGTQKPRPGWTRAAHLDTATRDGRPVIDFRGLDLFTFGKTETPDRCEYVYCDRTGTPRVIEIAQFPKTGAKDAEAVCDALNNYLAAGDTRAADRLALLGSDPRTLSLALLVTMQVGHFAPQRTGRYGALNAKAAAREDKATREAAAHLERMARKSAEDPAKAKAAAAALAFLQSLNK